MGQKEFGILFVAILVIAVLVLSFSAMSRMTNNSTGNPSPSASVDPIFQTQSQQQGGQGSLQNPLQDAGPLGQTNQSAKAPVRSYSSFPGVLSADQLANKAAVITTAKGKIVFALNPDTPKATSNFILLASNRFYDGLVFHRVVPGFVIQGGDPKGDGTGGPGYKFEDELMNGKYDKGVVAMANAGPNTNGSQFFIMLADHPELPPNYTIFGKVVQGQEVVDQIQVGDVMQSVQIANTK